MSSKELRKKLKSNSKLRVFIVILVTLLIAAMFPRGESIESDVTVGSIWIQDDLIASMPFEILKDPETYRIEKLQAAEKVNPVFEIDNTVKKSVIDSIQSFNSFLQNKLDEQLKQEYKG